MAIRYTHVVGIIRGDGLLHYERQVKPTTSLVLACNDRGWDKFHHRDDRIALTLREHVVTCLWCAAGKVR